MTANLPSNARNARIYVATANVAIMDILSDGEQPAGLLFRNRHPYLKRCLRRSCARAASPLPAGAGSTGSGAGHAEYEVQHAPDEQAQARPRDDVQGEVRTEIRT